MACKMEKKRSDAGVPDASVDVIAIVGQSSPVAV